MGYKAEDILTSFYYSEEDGKKYVWNCQTQVWKTLYNMAKQNMYMILNKHDSINQRIQFLGVPSGNFIVLLYFLIEPKGQIGGTKHWINQ